jgi:Amt family ammonium transporter
MKKWIYCFPLILAACGGGGSSPAAGDPPAPSSSGHAHGMAKYWVLLVLGTCFASPVYAAASGSASVEFVTGNLWLLVATAMVFLMHLGFATLEAGLTQEKNSINILFKNVSIVALGFLTYAAIGFNLMYPGEEYAGALFGFAGFGLGTDASGVTAEYSGAYTYWTDFIFQAVFAATAVTIVSGAVAERIRIETFLLFAILYLCFCYPVVGMWKWGGGFLDAMETPFYDFAGSTLVHSVGGWAALVGCLMLGPRLGKYVDGKVLPIAPSSLPLASIGAFLLWFGWYGFNGGSVLSADPAALSYVFVTTSLGAAAGVAGAMLGTTVLIKHLDLSMLLNGALAGLVSITAGADQLGIMDATIVGFIAGFLVVASVLYLDAKLKIDDPVGAISVHLVCGIWGTLAVGLFGNLASADQFISQLIGVFSVGLYCVIFASIAYWGVNRLLGLRVSEEVELAGLDFHEHGVSGYRGLRDTTPPWVTLLAPAYSSTVTGTIEVVADATDDRGVAGVSFTLDGEPLGEGRDTPPYVITWDTRSTPNGEHTLTAIAWDAAENHGSSVPFRIWVEN